MSSNKLNIRNLQGTLMRLDKPLLYINIENRKLIRYELLCDNLMELPLIFRHSDISMYSIEEFFKDRMIGDNTNLNSMYLKTLGLKVYDAESIIKKTNGTSANDIYWIKFNDGKQTYAELRNVRAVGSIEINLGN